jgi:sugar phosphate isomerase/epimerase
VSLALGINTCFAVKRWPRPADWAPIVARDLGLNVVQHSLDLVDLEAPPAEQAAELRDACAEHGIAVHSTFTGLAAYSWSLLLHPDAGARERAEAWFGRALEFTAQAGASMTGGHVGSLSRPDYDDPGRRAVRWADLRAALGRLNARAAGLGLSPLLFENMACEREPSTMADAEDLIAAGARLCLDVGHQCVPGTSGEERDPYAWLRRFGAGAPVIHLQQSDADGDHHWPFTERYNALGRIDAARVLAALPGSGPALILESIPSFEAGDGEVLAELRESVGHWRRALA